MQFSMSLNDCLIVGEVQIQVLEVRNDSVKLGINDPKASPVYREEVVFIRSEDDEPDDEEDTNAAFEPFDIRKDNRFAIPFA